VKNDGIPAILVGESDQETVDIVAATLGNRYSIRVAQTSSQLLQMLQDERYSYSGVLLDVLLRSEDGASVIKEIRQIDPSVPLVVVSTAAAPGDVVAAIKEGATDFLAKPFSLLELVKVLDKATQTQVRVPPPQPVPVPPPSPRGAYFGASKGVQRLIEILRRVGPSDVPVLIQGETGAGKEVFAREVHAHSRRAGRTFLKLNCAALPSELVESELFGYERGAFTGAMQRKAGMFEIADGGTLLLDEIGDMDFKLQAKLLQVLQDSTFQRLGGKEAVRVDVRIIAATHRNLETAIANGTFREDLYYRLNVISVEVPALRQRQADIIPLAEFLLKKYTPAGADAIVLTTDLSRTMLRYSWPGNIRELENMMRRLVIMRDQDAIIEALESRTARVQERETVTAATAALPAEPVIATTASVLERVSRAKEEAEMRAILQMLNQTHWNRKKAARLLDIDYKALLYKMKKLGIEERSGSEVPASRPLHLTAERGACG
jgi:two-component system response regulator AtoC